MGWPLKWTEISACYTLINKKSLQLIELKLDWSSHGNVIQQMTIMKTKNISILHQYSVMVTKLMYSHSNANNNQIFRNWLNWFKI